METYLFESNKGFATYEKFTFSIQFLQFSIIELKQFMKILGENNIAYYFIHSIASYEFE